VAVILTEIDNSKCSVDIKGLTALLIQKTTLSFETG
jgi:hypothetical protein